MATTIRIKATSAEMNDLFNEDAIGIHYFSYKSHEPEPSKNSIWEAEVRGHEKELTENRTYSYNGFLKKIGFDYCMRKDERYCFAIYINGEYYRRVPASITKNEVSTFSLGLIEGASLFRKNVSVYAYRKTNKGIFLRWSVERGNAIDRNVFSYLDHETDK